MFSIADVARLCGMCTGSVRRYIKCGALHPSVDGPPRFSWSALAQLRRWVRRRGCSPAKLGRALARARACGGRLVEHEGRWIIQDGKGRYESESGQQLLSFEERSAVVRLCVREGDAWDEANLAAERGDVGRAIELYDEHLRKRPEHANAWLEVGRLHHVRGALGHALACYRAALECADAPVATALFNLGVVHEDLGADADARVSYERALEVDASLADAHFNAARVCERLGDRWCALQHLRAYRSLVR